MLLIFMLRPGWLAAEDYRWIITYPNASNAWGRLVASGENKVVLKAQFIAITSADYKLTRFGVRPLQENPVTFTGNYWLVDSLQLWKNTDNYPGSLSHENDSLISQKGFQATPLQFLPTEVIYFDLANDELALDDTTTFFITMMFHDFHDTTKDNLEINGENGCRFGITVNKDEGDLIVSPESKTSNSWAGSDSLYYQFRAVNLPVVVYNKNRSDAEDSVRFYPNYSNMTTLIASHEEIITDLSFSAYINLPHSNLQTEGEEDRLSYASFKVGWDNTILQLDSLRYGDLWQGKAYSSDGSGFGEVEISSDPKYSIVRFEGLIMDDTNYVDIEHNNLAILDFRVIKPGISPIYLSDITLIDQWGIPYHVYQNLYNDTEAAAPQYDAWAKFNLGDFAYDVSSDLGNGLGDGQVDMTDISLFSNYIWLSPDSANWYERFDIGSPDSHDPDELSQDDTTNFYDLMVMATNYYRSYTGAFAQKAIAARPLTIDLQKSTISDREYIFSLNISNLSQLAAAQFKLKFDPATAEFLRLQPGTFLKNNSTQNLLIYHDPSLVNGILDLNFMALSVPISGTGELALIHLRSLVAATPIIELISADCRDIRGQQLEAEITTSAATLPEKYLTLANYPNPFNATTVIRFTIPIGKIGDYTLQIFDLRGHLVRTLQCGAIESGSHSIIWDGKDQLGQAAGSGIYLLSLKGKNTNLLRKITLIR
jgi:hypothetical protein